MSRSQTRFRVLCAWPQLGNPGVRRRRASSPMLEDLKPRVVMSASPTDGLPASIAQIAAQVATSADGHVALGNGVGVKQLVVETWKDEPYLFMINTNDEFYYGHMNDAAPNSGSFSGWTFVVGAAKRIAVDVWNDHPYIDLINTKNDLYLGDLERSTTPTPGVSPAFYPDVFQGWQYLGSDARDVTVVARQEATFLYTIDANGDLSYGELYNASYLGTPFVAFGGWAYAGGGAKSVSVVDWQGDPHMFMTDTNNDLYYGRLKPAWNGDALYATFGGWTYLTGAVNSVAVDVWQNAPYVYLIDGLNNLYHGHLYFDPASPGAASGQASFSGWSFIIGAAKSLSVQERNGKSVLDLINLKDHAYQGVQYASQTSPIYANTFVASFTGWYVIQDGKQVRRLAVNDRNAGTYYFTADSSAALALGYVTTGYWNNLPWTHWVWTDIQGYPV